MASTGRVRAGRRARPGSRGPSRGGAGRAGSAGRHRARRRGHHGRRARQQARRRPGHAVHGHVIHARILRAQTSGDVSGVVAAPTPGRRPARRTRHPPPPDGRPPGSSRAPAAGATPRRRAGPAAAGARGSSPRPLRRAGRRRRRRAAGTTDASSTHVHHTTPCPARRPSVRKRSKTARSRIRPVRPTADAGPSPGVTSGWRDPLGCSSDDGSRGAWPASGCSADTCASRGSSSSGGSVTPSSRASEAPQGQDVERGAPGTGPGAPCGGAAYRPVDPTGKQPFARRVKGNETPRTPLRTPEHGVLAWLPHKRVGHAP